MAALNSFYGGVIMSENLKVQLCPMCEQAERITCSTVAVPFALIYLA